MARFKPQLKSTETYTESNFLRLHTIPQPSADAIRIVTIEHLRYGAVESEGWRCETIVDREPMSKEDALFIARSYAERNRVPVVYECHGGDAEARGRPNRPRGAASSGRALDVRRRWSPRDR
jgi:hypothetical protein